MARGGAGGHLVVVVLHDVGGAVAPGRVPAGLPAAVAEGGPAAAAAPLRLQNSAGPCCRYRRRRRISGGAEILKKAIDFAMEF